MGAILRRLQRVEQNLALRPTAQDLRMTEIAQEIRERRRQRLEAQGLSLHERPPLPAEYQGRRPGIVDVRARRDCGHACHAFDSSLVARPSDRM